MKAIVLAGQRDGEDELTLHTGAICKAFVEISDRPMVLHVLNNLRLSACIDEIYLSGPGEDKLDARPDIRNTITESGIIWSPPGASPSKSTWQILQNLDENDQVVLTTADHPLLTPQIIGEFCEKSQRREADVVIGLAPYPLVHEAFPTMKKTLLKFTEGDYCGCNLFAFLTHRGRKAAQFWQRLEADRKNPLRIIRFLGWMTLARYSLGMLSLEAALARFSRKLDLRIAVVVLSNGHAAVDVDSVSDLSLVEERFRTRYSSTDSPVRS